MDADTDAESESSGTAAVSPLVRRLAEEFKVDLDTITGTGPEGRITRADVQRVAFGRAIEPDGAAGAGAMPVDTSDATIDASPAADATPSEEPPAPNEEAPADEAGPDAEPDTATATETETEPIADAPATDTEPMADGPATDGPTEAPLVEAAQAEATPAETTPAETAEVEAAPVEVGQLELDAPSSDATSSAPSTGDPLVPAPARAAVTLMIEPDATALVRARQVLPATDDGLIDLSTLVVRLAMAAVPEFGGAGPITLHRPGRTPISVGPDLSLEQLHDALTALAAPAAVDSDAIVFSLVAAPSTAVCLPTLADEVSLALGVAGPRSASAGATLTVALTVDTTAIDVAAADRFMGRLDQLITDPLLAFV
ncbi:MAG: E3 binding domain-containing protein [Actinomycetota bacterium]